MTLFSQVLRSTALLTGGKFVMLAIGLVQIKLVTDYLGTEKFGDYTTLFEFLAMFGFVADMGMLTVTLRELGKKLRPAAEVIGNILGLRLVLSVGAMAAAAATAWALPHYSDAFRFGVVVVGAGLVAQFLAGSMSALLQANFQIGGWIFSQVFGRLLTFGLVAWAVFADAGWDFLISANVPGNILLLFLMIPLASRFAKLSLRFDFEYWREILRVALPYGVALIFGTMYFKIDITLVHALRGSGEAGLYGIAMKLLEIGTILGVFLMNSTFTPLSGFLEKKNFAAVGRVIRRALEFLLLAGAAAVGLTLALAPGAILFISGPDFLPAAGALRTLFLALPVFFTTTVLGFLLVAIGLPRRLLAVNFLATLFNVGSNWLAIPHFGAAGAAATTVLTEVLILAGLAVALRGQIPARIFPGWAPIGRAIAAGTAAFFAAFFVENFWLGIAAGGAAFGLAALLTGAVRIRDLRAALGR